MRPPDADGDARGNSTSGKDTKNLHRILALGIARLILGHCDHLLGLVRRAGRVLRDAVAPLVKGANGRDPGVLERLPRKFAVGSGKLLDAGPALFMAARELVVG